MIISETESIGLTQPSGSSPKEPLGGSPNRHAPESGYTLMTDTKNGQITFG